MAGKSKLKAGKNVWENSDTMERVKSESYPMSDGPWHVVVPKNRVALYEGKTDWKREANAWIAEGPI